MFSFSSSSRSNMDVVMCGCSLQASLQTSWVNEDSGRRFYRCHNFKENGCGFFRWLDPPFCPRAREVIYGLKADFKNSKDEIHELKYKLLKKELETKSKEAKKLRNELECTKKGGLFLHFVVIVVIVLAMKLLI
ncbi:hypothetical protein L2E82_34891 [Cichorium intybus]|uniref:Uncharacterized protein n=1 Tax=Cichorium intybus TaxID=13427 RepID=A0ACB9BMY9_CICIN|nr:hypothetical protein L2E82_34891 [Cichorium intybus]